MRKIFTFVAAAFVALTMNAQAISVADAITACMALDSAGVSEADYTIEGYVVNAQDFNIAYNNQIFFLADDATNSASQEFEVYGGVAIENNQFVPVLNGDKVQVTAKLKKYWDKNNNKFIAETVNGTVVFVTKVDGDRTIATSTEITVAQALTIGTALDANGKTTDTYDIVGYVTQIDDNSFNTSYNNMTFWIADEMGTAATNADGAFEVYRGKPDQELEVGDKIRVRTQIQYYKGTTVESVSGAAVTFLEKGDVTPVEEADVVFTSADFNGQGTSGTGSEVTATKDGVTFTCDKAFGDQYGVRCYKGSVVTISSADQQIGKIVFEFATVSGKYYNGDLDEEIVVNGMEWTATLTNQARMNKISIYFGEYEQPVVDTLTAAEALAAAQALEVGATQKVVCMAYIANIKTPYSEEFGNITVWLNDDPTSTYGDIQAYRAKCSAEDGAAIAEHDLVLIEGNVTHTQNQDATKDYYEFASGAQLKLLQKAQGIENVVLTEKAQKVVVDGVLYIVRDSKMFNLQGAQVR